MDSIGAQFSLACTPTQGMRKLILRLLVLCASAVLRPRALQDAPAPADPNS